MLHGATLSTTTTAAFAFVNAEREKPATANAAKDTLDEQKDLEAYKADLTLSVQKELETHRANLAARVQHQRVGADLAMMAIRNLILVSGGSVLAILTFLGNLWTKSGDAARDLASAMVVSIGGIALALCLSLVTAMTGYVSALAQAHRLAGFATRPESTSAQRRLAKHAFRVRTAAIIFAIASLITFLIAAFRARHDK